MGGELTAQVSATAPSSNSVVTQLWRFGLVGCVGAVVDFGSLQLMIRAGVQPDVARAVSFLFGSTVAYLLNRRFTFPSRRNTREVVAVAAVYGATFVLILGVNLLTRTLVPDWAWPITVAWVVSQGIGTSFNFLAQRRLVFRPVPAGVAPA
jgi:putative flippase GtrA